jgi:LPXTG-site transpeptidase (sortase) family protein
MGIFWLSGFMERLKEMDALIQQRKLPGKDLGSWLIILGYVVVVLSIVNIVRGWASPPVDLEAVDDLILPSQGFIPYLDRTGHISSDGEEVKSDFNEVHNSAASAQLASAASWEISIPEVEAFDSSTTSPMNLDNRSALERWLPEYLTIPEIGLDVPIMATDSEEVEVQGEAYRQWLAPNSRVAGWQPSSASLGINGNTVLMGHHNVYGEVFRDLASLDIGDRIWVLSGERIYKYRVRLKMILPEKYESIDTRLENARWIQPTQDERLTLITCWPYETNTHRVILVAEPLRDERGEGWENRFPDR